MDRIPRRHISVVIPVLNEEAIVSELLTRVLQTIKKISPNIEVIIIDDGSTDKTWKEITDFTLKNSNIRGIKLSRNFGHHYAISAGLQYANSDWVVVMDGDLQDRPEVITDLYNEASKGFDIVFVSRTNRPESLYYRFLQKLFYMILRMLSGVNFNSQQANFSIISNKVVDSFNKFPEYSRFYGSTLNWLGFTRSSINANHGTRKSGRSSYTLKKRVKLAADVILSFSDRPLHFAIYLGVISSSAALMLMTWIVYRFVNVGFSVEGWPSLMAILLLIGGIILIILGIIGSYLSRIFLQVKARPLFLIQDEISSSISK
jgi:glycosyltransferase involved in cell wall biosynthesis